MTFRSSHLCVAATLASLAFAGASPSLDAAYAALPAGTACSALLARPTLDSISEALWQGLREAITTGLCDRPGIKVVVPVWRRPEISGVLWSLAAERRLSCTS